MSLFSKLFGGSKSAPEPDPEVYKDVRIYPTPQSTNGGFRLAARLEKDFDGETKVHDLMRADTIQSRKDAEYFAIRKAQQVIDEQGDALFR